MAEAEISSAKDAGGRDVASYGAPSDGGQTYFEALVAALSQPEDGAAEPPLFTAATHWQPWREEDLFLARPPHPLPRAIERLPSSPSTDPARDVSDLPVAPPPEMSNFRRLLAPAAILSLLALAAITHGAVANRAAELRAGIRVSEDKEPPPFSLSGQWRRLGQREAGETPRLAAFVVKPGLAADAGAEQETEATPPVVASAIDAIATLPLVTASFTPMTRTDATVSAGVVTEPAAPSPPVAIAPVAPMPPEPAPPAPHYSSAPTVPLTDFSAGEPDSAPPHPYMPAKLIVAKVSGVEALRSGATNATHAPNASAEAAPVLLQKAAAMTAAKTIEPEPPQVKKKPKATPARATPQAANQSAPPAPPRAPDTVMRDSP